MQPFEAHYQAARSRHRRINREALRRNFPVSLLRVNPHCKRRDSGARFSMIRAGHATGW